jgi:hypothetical protein
MKISKDASQARSPTFLPGSKMTAAETHESNWNLAIVFWGVALIFILAATTLFFRM